MSTVIKFVSAWLLAVLLVVGIESIGAAEYEICVLPGTAEFAADLDDGTVTFTVTGCDGQTHTWEMALEQSI
jgi:hypothetical protein